MADNVPITAGSGTNIATDDCGADAANGLDVDITRIALAWVDGADVRISCTGG